MKKYFMVLTISLICYAAIAQITPRNFQTVEDLIADLKQPAPANVYYDHILYDTNGAIVGVELPPSYSTDRNLHLLSKIKSIRYLLICCGRFTPTNAISALAEYPNLTGLGLVCFGGRAHTLVSDLPALTNLQSLFLAQNSYQANDAIYLAKLTNLVTLQIVGAIPQTRTELLDLTNLVNLRKLVLSSEDKYVNKVDTKLFSSMDKLTNLVVTSDYDDPAVTERVWNALQTRAPK